MKISVCVACYNVEKYISECLDSLVMQTLKDIEIICVDDGSSDSTLKIISDYSKRYDNIKIIRNLFNSKLIQTRKMAIANSIGDYIMFVDADDVLEVNACEIAYGTIVKNKADVVEFNCKQIDVNSREINNDKQYCNLIEGELRDEEIFEEFRNNKIGQMLWNKIYKADLVKDVYLMISLSELYYKEDVFMTSLIYNFAKSYYGITDKLYRYRVHSGQSRITQVSLEQYRDRCRCAAIVQDMIKCFYSQSDLTELQVQLTKSKMNNWLKKSNLDELLKHKNDDNFKDYLNIFIGSWFNEDVFNILNSCINNAVTDIFYTQLRLLLECLQTVTSECGNAVVLNNDVFKNIINKFSSCKKYNINIMIESIINSKVKDEADG